MGYEMRHLLIRFKSQIALFYNFKLKDEGLKKQIFAVSWCPFWVEFKVYQKSLGGLSY
jgi:hypothetical protein